MNKQTKKFLKRKKHERKAKNKVIADRQVMRKKMRGTYRPKMRVGQKLAKMSPEDKAKITKMLRETLGLPENDNTPIEKLVEAVNLKNKQIKEAEKTEKPMSTD